MPGADLTRRQKQRLRHVSNRSPRVSFCTGCEKVFGTRKEMRDHRNTNHCGGRFNDPIKAAMWRSHNSFSVDILNATQNHVAYEAEDYPL